MLARRAFITAALSAMALRPTQAASPLTIFAAASLKTALDELADPLRRATGTSIRMVYASSAALARQIEQGAPADLFWSADRDWMEWCTERNLIRSDTIHEFLGNRLVLIAPRDAPSDAITWTTESWDAALGKNRIATGETRSVPAGRYAREALQSLGLWDRFASRLAESDNVRAALLLTARGETPLGIVYASDAIAEPRVKIVATFPPQSHAPIVYPVALTRHAPHASGYAAINFFNTEPARGVFVRNGFSILRTQSPA